MALMLARDLSSAPLVPTASGGALATSSPTLRWQFSLQSSSTVSLLFLSRGSTLNKSMA